MYLLQAEVWTAALVIVDGTLLTPPRKVRFSPGLVNGAVYSGIDIRILSGSNVRSLAGRLLTPTVDDTWVLQETAIPYGQKGDVKMASKDVN